MKLARVSFLGVRGLADATYDLVGPSGVPHDLVVVTGPTASGKTRFLEAVVAAKEAIAPYGLLQAGAPWVASGSVGAVAVTPKTRPPVVTRRPSLARPVPA